MSDADTDHMYLGKEHWPQLKADLQRVGWVADELDTVLIRQSRYSERQAYRKITEEERPVPFHDKASELAHELNGLLNEWINRVCRSRKIGWPGYMRTPKAANWMDNHHVYLALTEGSEDFFHELKSVVRRATRLVDRPPGTVYAGPCPSRGAESPWCGDLYARLGAKNVKCQHCEKSWDVSELREYMMEDARQTLGTAAELAGILPWFMDAPIDRKRIAYLVRRKLVTSRPVGGVDRYQLGEIVDAHNMLIAHKNSA